MNIDYYVRIMEERHDAIYAYDTDILKVKADYQDAFLFFRLGDFYEMFFEDAVKAAHELEITLTSRDGGSSERIPMCGVPHHAAKNYIEQLVEKGYKVAVVSKWKTQKQLKV